MQCGLLNLRSAGQRNALSASSFRTRHAAQSRISAQISTLTPPAAGQISGDLQRKLEPTASFTTNSTASGPSNVSPTHPTSSSEGSGEARSVATIPFWPSPNRRIQALGIISNFLSPKNFMSEQPMKLALSTLFQHYRLIRGLPNLHDFVHSHSDMLIGTLGTLLTRTPAWDKNLNVLASLVHCDTRDVLPRFVLEVAHDKNKYRHGFIPANRHWKLAAFVEEVNLQLENTDPTRKFHRTINQSVWQAHKHYLYLRNMSKAPTSHAPYLEALLRVSRSKSNPELRTQCWEELLEHMSAILTTHKHLYPPLLPLLWEVVLDPPLDMSPEQTKLLSHSFCQRLAFLRDRKWTSSHLLFVTSPAERSSWDIRSVANAITDAFFTEADVPKPLKEWIIEVSHTAHDSSDPSRSYDNLKLLSLVSASSSLWARRQLSISHSSSSSPLEADWRVVCTLASLEREFNSDGVRNCVPLVSAMAHQTVTAVETAWRDWVSFSTGPNCRPRIATAAILGSFFHLLSKTDNMELVAALYDHCVQLELFTQDGLSSSSELRELFAEYVIAYISCSPQSLDRTLHTVMTVLSALPAWEQTNIMNKVVLRFTRLPDTVLSAQQLYRTMQQYNVVISSTVVRNVAQALAQANHLEDALTYISVTSDTLSLNLKFDVLASILKVVAYNERETNSKLALNHSFASQLVKIMAHILAAHKVPLTYLTNWERSLQALARASNASHVVAIAKDLMRGHTESTFPTVFWTSIFRSLLKQRHFRTSSQLLSHLQLYEHFYSKETQLKWKDMLHRHFLRKTAADSTKVFKGLVARDGGRMHKQSRMRPQAVLTLRLPKLLFMMERLEAEPCITTCKALVRAGRIEAAKRLRLEIFVRMQEQDAVQVAANQKLKWPSAAQMHTILGNLILGAVSLPSRRGKRRVQKTHSTFEELVREGGFVPDRVSVNILLKSLLQWKKGEVDWLVVRRLMDGLVRSGYPVYGVVQEGESPFGTTPAVDAGALVSTKTGTTIETSELDMLISAHYGGPISWRRHVRPLYKMIIKALYVRGDTEGAKKVLAILKAGNAKYNENMVAKGRAMVEKRRAQGAA